jgi:hypothetical protein
MSTLRHREPVFAHAAERAVAAAAVGSLGVASGPEDCFFEDGEGEQDAGLAFFSWGGEGWRFGWFCLGFVPWDS